MSKKVIIGLSGGVDSSVAAALLVAEGYEVIGVTMNIWDGIAMAEHEGRHACFGPDEKEDAEKAAQVCGQLGIPFYEFDLKKEYRDTVLEYFSSEYSLGRTPNPCVRCNSRMKFGALVEKVAEQGIEFDFFATGHYVRKGTDPRYGTVLKKGFDDRKDQSYFLCRLTREQLSRAHFPLGELEKTTVKTLAKEYHLGFDHIPESQDFICGDYTELLETEPEPGDIVDAKGNILGRHKGYQHYTIGQRRGLGVAAAYPLYVVEIDSTKNQIIVGPDAELYKEALTASSLNWLIPVPEASAFPLEVEVKIRSQQKPVLARIALISEDLLEVRFAAPQRAVAPGQSVVLYQEDIVLGGGIIQG